MGFRNITRTHTGSITVADFQKALSLQWKQIGKLTPKKAPTPPLVIGLAVSGGVDSMCLAALASSLQRERPAQYQFRALVVDHKARQGSTEEVQVVREWLERRGLPTSVLELQWPDNIEPLKLNNFESRARTLRYRALGLECHRLGVKTLLMGHHSDDQAETVMSRIIQGYTGSGLAGITPEGPLPECWGYYGIHNTSGGVPRQAQVRWAGKPLTVNRPLLNYTKDQLRSTCQELNMEWTEDKTNLDPTLTVRNAVRYLFNQNLPAALNRESILSLSASVAEKNLEIRGSAAKLLKKFKFLTFDLRAGVIRFRLPVWGILDGLKGTPSDLKPRLAMAMAQVADSVSPTGPMTMNQGFEIVQRMFQHATQHPAFTIGEVYFHHEGYSANGSAVWALWRRPIESNVLTAQEKLLEWTKDRSMPTVAQEVEAGKTTFGHWLLYDGRFWLRIWTTKDFKSLMVRPLEKGDMAGIADRLKHGGREKQVVRLIDRLKSAAPGDIRYSLPALVEYPDGPVLALPSMGMYTTADTKITRGVFWEVNYKYVPLYAVERGRVIHDQSFVLERFLKTDQTQKSEHQAGEAQH